MDSSTINRQLAAIVFVDLVGYSALMQQSERRADAAVAKLWSIVRPLAGKYEGEEIRSFGDGMLLIFPGTVAAAQCCVHVLMQIASDNRQTQSGAPIAARIGLHVGDITRRNDDIYGDGVNIAARLVNLAPAGAIALSPHARDQLHNTLEVAMKSLGLKRLKNIAKPMEVFCVPGPECRNEDLELATADASPSTHRLWNFGSASYNEISRELSLDDVPCKLPSRVLDILQLLLEHAGEIVSRSELCSSAGGISGVALDRSIQQLREVLHDADQSIIASHPDLGYRLTARVSVDVLDLPQLSQFDFREGDSPPMRPMWTLERKLGQGGQGEVWLGRHSKTGERRVYKFALDDQSLASVRREITLARILAGTPNHRHYVRVLDWNLKRPPFFLECEYSQLGTLQQWSDSEGGLSNIPLETRLKLMAQVAEATASAHSIGIIHKDIKPSNILVDRLDTGELSIKLADFGSGGVLDPQNLADAGITLMGFSQSIQLLSDKSVGTPIYCAPEILAGQPATVQGDIYALGVVLYQLVVGDFRKPLSTGWELNIEDELLRGDIFEATQGDPQLRLADAGEMAERILQLDTRHQQKRSEQRTREQAAQARISKQRLRNNRRWSLAVISALSLGMSFAVYEWQQATEARRQAELAVQQANQAAQREKQTATEAQAVSQFLAKDLFGQMQTRPLRDLTVVELLQQASDTFPESLESLPLAAAQVHEALGTGFLKLFKLELAEPHFAKAQALYDSFGSSQMLHGLRIANNLLSIRFQTGALGDSLKTYEQRLLKASETVAFAAPELRQLEASIIRVAFLQGDWRDSTTQLQQSLESDLANGLPFNFSQALQLALQLYYLDDLTEADRWIRRTMESFSQNGALPPPVKVHILGLQAAIALKREHFDESNSHLEDARKILAPWAIDSSDLMALTIDLAEAQRDLLQNNPEIAAKSLERSLKIIEQFQSSMSPNIYAEYRIWYARALRKSGSITSAAGILQEVINAQVKLDLQQHPFTDLARIELVKTRLKQSKLEKAAGVLARIDEASLKTKLGEHHRWIAELYRMRGLLAYAQGQNELALLSLTTAQRIASTQLGPAHRLSMKIQGELMTARQQSSRKP